MKTEITESNPDSFGVEQLQVWRRPEWPASQAWSTSRIAAGHPAFKKLKDFFKNYLSNSLEIENPSLGRNKPYGRKIKVLSNEPDGLPQIVDAYFRRFGTKNENFWERVRAGDIVVQDDFFVSQSVALLNNVRTEPKDINSLTYYHTDQQRFDPMFPAGTIDLKCDIGVVPCIMIDGMYYVALLTQTNNRVYIPGRYEDISVTGYDKKMNFSYMSYAYTRDLNCDLYTEALASANSANFDLLTELAELPETVRYLIGRLKDFAKILVEYQELKKLRVTKVRKRRRRESSASYNAYVNSKSINDTTDASLSLWMEYRYAIMTLVYSLQDLHSYFQSLNDVYKTTRKRLTYAAPDDWFYIPNGFTVERNDVQVHDRIWIKRKYDLDSLFTSLMKGLQTNLFKTAWELIPLSFVVDWFINIGDLIDSLLSYQPYLIERQTSSRQLSGTLKLRHKDGFTVTHNVKTYHRFLIRDGQISFLNIENGMNFVRTIDALALTYKPVREKLASLRKTL